MCKKLENSKKHSNEGSALKIRQSALLLWDVATPPTAQYMVSTWTRRLVSPVGQMLCDRDEADSLQLQEPPTAGTQ